MPLITLPYLARVLGPEYYGLVMMAQATMIYFTILTDYGFNLSATKDIAAHQSDTKKVSDIFSAVIGTKCVLLLIGMGILTILVQTIPVFNAHAILFYASFLIVIGNTFLPSFLFQGLEKMSFIATFNLIAKCSFTALIFIVITSTSDYQWVHALWGISYIIVDIAAFIFIRTKCNVRLTLPSINQIKALFGISFEYFLSRVAIAIYLSTNVIIIGILLSPSAAGIYGGAEKLLLAITTFYAPLIETIYPYMSRTKNINFAKKVLGISIGINTIGCLLAFALAPIVIPIILGASFADAVPLFRWMMIIAFLHLPASIIGYPILGAIGHVKTANRSVIVGAIIHLIMVIITYPMITSPLHFVWIMIASQSIILIWRLIKFFQIQNSN